MNSKVHVFESSQLETIADDFLAEKLGSAIRIPIDIDNLVATLTPKVLIDCRRGLTSLYHIEGMVLRDTKTGRLVIWVDEGLMDDESPKGRTRYRTTVAEELSHIVLHRDVLEQVSTVQQFTQLHRYTQTPESVIEANAKRLAVASMPRAQVRLEVNDEYKYRVHQMGTDDASTLNRVITRALADIFQVSEYAMGNRLQGLGHTDNILRAARRGETRVY